MAEHPSKESYEPLTEREGTVLQLVADGLSNQEIADHLTLSLHTVKTYVRHIFGKLGVSRRTQAVAVARSLGLLATADAPPPAQSIPTPITPLIGREEEVAEVTGLLDDPEVRLVTILGPGGVGKTRLGLEVAAQLHEQMPGDIAFVPLESVTSSEDVAPAVAAAIRFQLQGEREPEQQVLDVLRERQMLLVMDNFEHLLEAAPFLTDLLAAAPGVSILATSRERLNLRGETIFTLQGLDYPAELEHLQDYSALTLFVRTARRVQPAFQPSAEDLLHVSRVCQLVEGMPLGIELAAAWLDVLTPEHLAGEIEKGVTVLQTQSRDVPQRHQSIYAVFEHSWALLSAEEQGAYKKLSVFRGGFDRAAAEGVARATLFMLSTLVDKSLVARSGPDRYQLHELLRQVAHEKLVASAEEHERVRDDHCAYFASLAQQHEAVSKWNIRSMDVTVAQAQRDYENFLAGWHRALERPSPDKIGAYTYTLGVSLFEVRGLIGRASREFGAALQQLRAHPEHTQPSDLTRVLTWNGWFALSMGDLDLARQVLDEAGDLAETLGESHLYDAGMALNLLGWLNHLQGHTDTGRQQLVHSLEMSREANSALGTWQNLVQLGEIDYDQGRYEAAGDYYRESLAVAQREEFLVGALISMPNLAILHCTLGDFAVARDLLRQTLVLNRDVMMTPPLFLVVLGIAALNAQQGRSEPALEILAIALHHPRIGVVARGKAGSLLAEFRSLFSDTEVDTVLEQAAKGQLSDRYLEPNFTINAELVDRLGTLLDEAA